MGFLGFVLALYNVKKFVSVFIKSLKLSKEILEAQESSDIQSDNKVDANKIKVNYPLFVKKSKSNIFKRAGKADLNKMKQERREKILKKRKLMKKTANNQSKSYFAIKIKKFHS